MRIVVAIAALALAAGCSHNAPLPALPDLAGVEKDAVKVSDALAEALTVASALDDEATVHAAAAAMADCKGKPEEAACKQVARANEVGRARPRREALKNAVAAQHALADALKKRARCRADGDLACVVQLSKDVAKRLPELIAQVDDVKGMLPRSAP